MLREFDTGPGGPIRTVLVVDDQPEVRELYRLNLEFAGYRVAEAADGRTALDAVASGAVPDCVLLDLMLPGIDGWEVLAALRRQLAAHVPVLVVSARSDRDGLTRVLDAGADAYLVKPFPPRMLVDAVNSLFDSAGDVYDLVADSVAPHRADAARDVPDPMRPAVPGRPPD